MIIPVGLDQDEVRRTPYVSYTIIAANIFMFVFSLLEPAAARSLMLVPAHADVFHMLTSTFLHGGLEHLLGNLLFFYITGPFVEDAWGRPLFTLFYFAAALAADFVDVVHDPASTIPRIGASGAIAGVMGAFLVRFGGRRIRFLWRPFVFTSLGSREFRVPAWLYLPFWFGTSLLIAESAGDSLGTAEWAHVGGFGFGVFVAFVVWAIGYEKKFVDPAVEGLMPQNEILLQAMDEGRAGRFTEARRSTARVLAADPRNLDARRLAFDLAVRYGDPAEIARTDAPLLDRLIETGDKELIHDLIGEVRRDSMAAASSRFLMRAGDFLAGDGDPAGALVMYDRAADLHPNDAAGLKALLKITDLRQKRGDLAGAWKALERANRHPAFTPEWLSVFDQRRAKLSGAR